MDPRLTHHRRATGFAGTAAVTLLAAVLPGSGYLWTGRRLLGWVVVIPAVALTGMALWQLRSFASIVELAVAPDRLRQMVVLTAVAVAVWSTTVITTYLMVRPSAWNRRARTAGVCLVTLLCVAVAAPVTVAARYALVQADLVDTVFEDNETATVPEDVTVEDPWGGRRRVNVLLLGGDGGVGRVGIRTDTVILLSMDTHTGDSVMFSLPRNMMNAQFPPDSPLYDVYPEGFRGDGDAGSWMLNAVYGQVPLNHPGILGRSDNEGADAIKQAVAGSLGVQVDYYILVNLGGFRQVVEAMGGVTVNINQPIPIGGNQDRGVPPSGYLQPGPAQHLNGLEALWFARGRYGLDDYNRMLRQRCLVQALIDEADPPTVLRRYEDLAAAGKEIVRTDIPAELLPAFVDLAMHVKTSAVSSIAFVSSDLFFPGDPDFDWLRAQVQRALKPSATTSDARPGPARPPRPSSTPSAGAHQPSPAVEGADTCDYQPVSGAE